MAKCKNISNNKHCKRKAVTRSGYCYIHSFYNNKKLLFWVTVISLLFGFVSTIGLIMQFESNKQISNISKYTELNYKQSVVSIDQRNYKKAKTLLNDIIKLDPHGKFADNALGRLGQISFREGNYKNCIWIFSRLLTIYPQTEIRDEIYTSLRWSILNYVNKSSFENSLNFIDSLYKEYKLEEISPYYLIVDPGNLYTINKEEREYKELSKKFSYIYKKYGNRKYVDYAMYMLGNYDQIIKNYRNRSDIIDKVYFTKAEVLYYQSSYKEAINAYNNYIKEFPNNNYCDNAQYQIASCYEKMGNYVQAVYEYNKAIGLPDSDMATASKYKALYLTEQYLIPKDIAKLVKKQRNTLFYYCLAVKYLETMDLGKAVKYLKEAKDAAKDTAFVNVINERINYYKDIDKLYDKHSDKALYETAKKLYQNAHFIYNVYWDDERQWYTYDFKDDYFQRQNNYCICIKILNEAIDKYPLSQYRPRIYFLLGKCYSQLALRNSFMGNKILNMNKYSLGNKATDYFNRVIKEYPENELCDDSQGEQGVVLLNLAEVKNEYIQEDVKEIKNYLEEALIKFNLVVDKYPKSNAANNALNWISVINCKLASFSMDDNIRNEYYKNAIISYKKVVKEYPTSRFYKNAVDNILILENRITAMPSKTSILQRLLNIYK